jgi:hypothetical protein
VKKLLVLAVLAFPFSASADHMDVIQVTLKENCTLQTYVAIKDDFNNQWGKNHGYRAEITVPIQSQDLAPVFWVGRSADAASFGKAWDAWRTELMDPASLASKLNARFTKCSDNVSRSGWDVY